MSEIVYNITTARANMKRGDFTAGWVSEAGNPHCCGILEIGEFVAPYMNPRAAAFTDEDYDELLRQWKDQVLMYGTRTLVVGSFANYRPIKLTDEGWHLLPLYKAMLRAGFKVKTRFRSRSTRNYIHVLHYVVRKPKG